MTWRTAIGTASLVLTLTLTAGCGGGGGSNGVEGGISGSGKIGATGTGTVTGFGSVIINDDRVFAVADDTGFSIDGVAKTEQEFEQEAEGLKVQFLVRDDVNDDLTRGTAAEFEAANDLKGPVTSLAPLEVLGQAVVVTGDTVLADLGDVSQLLEGDVVEVSGYANDANVLQATRLQRKAGGTPVWKLTGVVTGQAGDVLSIGSQQVDVTGIDPRDCPATLTGALVEIVLAPDAGFGAGDTLDTVTDLECTSLGLAIPDDPPATLQAEVEGLVTEITSASDPNALLLVNGQEVSIGSATAFENGTFEDLALGVKLEAEGTLSTTTRVLAARTVSFRENRVRVRAPADGVDVASGTVTLLGSIAVRVTALTESDDFASLGDIPQDTVQLEIRGFVDGSGTVFATEIKDRGAPDGRVRLRGPVASDPAPADPVFTILGVTVDTTGTSDDGFRFEATPLSRDAFFNLIGQGGLSVQADGDFQGGVIEAKEVQIED